MKYGKEDSLLILVENEGVVEKLNEINARDEDENEREEKESE